MSAEYQAFKDFLASAERTRSAVRDNAGTLVELLVGNLRSVRSSYQLGRLKKELSKFNIHTGRWRD